MSHEPCKVSARVGSCAGIWLAIFTSAAPAQTQLSLQETGLNVTANHSGNQVVNIHLDSLGPKAAVYAVVGRSNGQAAGAQAAAVARSAPAPAIVGDAGAVDWNAPHESDELIVCYDKEWVGGLRRPNPVPAMRQQKNALHVRMGTALKKELRLINADVVKVLPGVEMKALARRYAKERGVRFVQPNYVYSAIALPDDPNFPFVPSSLGPPDDQLLWGLHTTAQDGARIPSNVVFDSDIDAAEAWEVTTGSADVVVAVIDTGVDYTHPDIAANMWVNAGEVAGNAIDDDGNGYVDDIHGFDFRNNDGDPMDDHYHGTHVAGTIGAVGNNGVNIAGVNWNVRIMALKFLGASGSGTTADAIESVDYAVLMGAAISNNSWGGFGFDAGLLAAIHNAGAAGHLFLAAAGNDTVNTDITPFYPSTYQVDSIISVAAWDKNEQLADFSNYGATTTDLAAPGVGTYSLQLGGGIVSLSGTSMATPHVAGVAALLKAVRPEAGPLQIKQWILDGVTPHPNLAGKVLTGGRLNAVEPLRLATMPWLRVGNREGIIASGGSLTIPVTFVTQNVPVGSYSGSLIVLDLSYDNAVTPRIEIPVTMELEFVELPPVVEDVYQHVVRNVDTTVTLIGSDPNIGQSVSFTIETLPAQGTLIDPATSLPISSAPHSLAGGANTVVYSPTPNQLYTETFQYTATDGSSTSNVGTVTVEVIQPPHAPEDVSAYSGTIFVDLNWLPNIEPDLAGYCVYASPSAGGPYLKVTSALHTSTTYRHYYLSRRVPTYYVITAVLDNGAESGFSAAVVGQPTYPPTTYTPVNLRGTAGYRRVYLEWEPPQDFNGTYRIIRSLTGGGDPEIIGELSERLATTYIDEEMQQYGGGPENGVTYDYYVENYTYWDLWGAGSNLVTVTPNDSTPPSMPTGLQAVGGAVFVDVTWDANPELDIDEYWVLRSTTPGGPYDYQGSVRDRRFYDPAVTAATTYYYVIAAVDLDGEESDYTAEASGTPHAPGTCTVNAHCDDGSYCNGAETCVAGQCQAGTSVNCNDGVACTADSCNEGTDSCDHVANNAACDNGLYCDGAETCNVTLGCQSGVSVNCDDSVACTVDSCNEGTDSCGHTPNNAACDNGLYCDGAETCNVTLGCQAGVAVNCDDGVACTVDSCNEGTDSCNHSANNAACDNGLYCDGVETCNVTLGCQSGSDPCPGQTCDEVANACVSQAEVWLSFIDSAAVPNVGTVENEDIVARNMTTGAWSLIFDGSDVGLSAFTIDGMAAMSDGSILLSFAEAGSVAGMTGGPDGTTLDDSDIVRFIPTSLGANTAGSFVFYFDGSDVGLTTDNEDIDAIALTPSGQLVVSTLGAVSANGASGADTDLLLFNATSLGSVTAGTFSVYFDGSDVGLSDNGNEDVDAVAIRSSGVILLSTLGNFSVTGLNGADEDVAGFTPTQLGSTTSGTYSMFLDLSTLGIATSEDVGAVEYQE